MYNNSKVAKSVRYALLLGASTTAFTGAAVAQQQANDEQAERVERIQVTGSRLNRTDLEGALPVTVISRDDIDASGEVSIADFMRDTNFNSFGSFQSTSGSSGSGASQVSLRGLGAGRTLILIDGRRAPTSPILGSGQDLNSIPMAAVERIEVLSDGASAVYGSDAIGGVINVILRSDYEGVEVTIGAGRPTNAGGDTEELSFLIGSSNSRGNVLFGASYSNRDVIMTRDRDYLYPGRGASVYSNNFGFMNTDDDGNPTGHASQPSNPLLHPEFGTAVPGLCTDEEELFWTTGSGVDTTCQFDHSATSAGLTSMKNTSMFGRGNFEINRDWNIYVNGGLNMVEAFGRYAALPSSPWPGGAIELAPGTPNHPGTIGGYNPHASDPYYQGIADQTLSLYHRFASLGPRDNTTENTTIDFDGGLQGMIGEVSVEFGARYVKSRAVNLGRNYVVGGLAQAPITDGRYNIYDPFTVYDPVTGEATEDSPTSLGMSTTTARDMFFTAKEFYANAAFDVFSLPNGAIVSAALGAEYREENFQNQYDLLSSAGQVAGSSGASSFGSRDVTAVYGEMLFPVLDDLDIEIAGRFDDYSDYGSDFSPKVAARWSATPDLLFRASWGQGFRAPSLSQLSQEPAFGAVATNDPATCQMMTGGLCSSDPSNPQPASIQVNTYSMGNVNLTSETSEQFSLGVVWDAAEWLNLSLDYYNIEIDGAIGTANMGTVVGCLRGTVEVCPDGISQFDVGTAIPNAALGLGAIFQGNDVNGAIIGVQTGSVNLGTVETDGFDFTARTNFDLGWGRLSNNLSVSYVNNYSTNNGNNVVGTYNPTVNAYPRYRASFNNSLTVSDFSFNWNISITDGTTDNFLVDGEPASQNIPTWIIHNVQANYHAPWNATITVGVNNLLDEEPADASYMGPSYLESTYNPWGRVPYIRYTQRF